MGRQRSAGLSGCGLLSVGDGGVAGCQRAARDLGALEVFGGGAVASTRHGCLQLYYTCIVLCTFYSH